MFWKTKLNCWEFTGCERGPGGKKTAELGLCPVAMDKSAHGINGGKNGGRICWSVAASCCRGTQQGDQREKQLECMRCGFFQHLMQEGGPSLTLHKPGKAHHNAIIQDRMTILALLNQGYRNNLLFGISSHQSNFRTTGTLIGIYPEHNLIIFSSPRTIQHQLTKDEQLQIAGRLHGAIFQFTSKLFGSKLAQGGLLIKARLPDYAYHPQMRQSYRVSLLSEQRPFQAYIGDTDNKVEGYVVDISIDGLGLIIHEPTTLKPGDILKNCTIQFSDGKNLTADIEVRHANYNPQRKASRLGGRFHDITQDGKHWITEYVNHMQREEARRLRQHEGLIA